jgi:hypothetical protein
MKPSPLRHLPVAAVFGFALLAAPAAHAFTIENQDSGGASSQNFLDPGKAPAADPDEQVTSRFGSGGQGTFKSGNTTLQFGAQPSFEQQYNSNQMFKQYDLGGDR